MLKVVFLCFKIAFKLGVIVLKGLFYMGYGAARLVGRGLKLPGSIKGASRLLGSSLPCPCCREQSALLGRWTCGACSGTYVGFVGECGLCHASCSFFPCSSCGGSIAIGGKS